MKNQTDLLIAFSLHDYISAVLSFLCLRYFLISLASCQLNYRDSLAAFCLLTFENFIFPHAGSSSTKLKCCLSFSSMSSYDIQFLGFGFIFQILLPS